MSCTGRLPDELPTYSAGTLLFVERNGLYRPLLARPGKSYTRKDEASKLFMKK